MSMQSDIAAAVATISAASDKDWVHRQLTGTVWEPVYDALTEYEARGLICGWMMDIRELDCRHFISVTAADGTEEFLESLHDVLVFIAGIRVAAAAFPEP